MEGRHGLNHDNALNTLSVRTSSVEPVLYESSSGKKSPEFSTSNDLVKMLLPNKEFIDFEKGNSPC